MCFKFSVNFSYGVYQNSFHWELLKRHFLFCLFNTEIMF